MKITPLLTVATGLLLFASFSSHAVTLDSVRYCTSSSPVICNGKTQDEYRHWQDHNVRKGIQRKTFIARYNTPAVASTRRLVFIADGQANGPDNDWDFNGYADQSAITGRITDFRDEIKSTDATVEVDEVAGSFPHRILNGELNGFSEDNTFVAASWDTRFNYGASEKNLKRIGNAYFDWLATKYTRENLEVVVLVGHSRGGALATVLARKFHLAYPEIPVLVYTLEGVPNRKRDTPPMSNDRLRNPVTDDKKIYGYGFDFKKFYGSTTNLRAVNILSGRKFIYADANRVRPMAQDHEVDGEQSRFFNWDWLQQEWIDASHGSFNNAWASDYVFNDLTTNIDALTAVATSDNPPVAKCALRSLPFFSRYLIAGDAGSFSPNGHAIVDAQWAFYEPQGNLAEMRSGNGPHRIAATTKGHWTAELTVTDAAGRSASATCTAKLR